MAKKESKARQTPPVLPSVNTLVVSSNDLLEAKYNFSLWQKRVFVYMVNQINKKTTEFTLQRIYVRDLMDFFGVKSKDDYQTILRVPENLFNARVHTPYYTAEGLKRWRNTRIISTYTEPADRDERNAYIELQFNNDLKEHLLELHEAFTKYDVRNIIELRSVYSFRMFELLKSRMYRRDLLSMRLIELKEILDVEEKYKNYADFKRFVLQQAQKDLTDHCDITYTFKEKKAGRRVDTLIFDVVENIPTGKKILIPSIASPINPETLPIFERVEMQVKDWGISPEVLQLLIDTQPEDAIIKGLAYTQREIQMGRVKENKAGFFINAVKNRYTSTAFEREQKREKTAADNRQRLAQMQKFEQQLDSLSVDYTDALNDVIRALTTNNPAITENAVEAVKKENVAYFKISNLQVEKMSLEDFRQNRMLRGWVIQKIQEQNPEAFEFLEEKYLIKMRDLEAAIKALNV